MVDEMKMNSTGAAWLRDQGACAPGYDWALENCATLREVVERAKPDWMRWVAARALPQEARAEWLARALDRVVGADADPRTLAVAPALHRWAAGQIGNDEMERVAAAAADAADIAADSAAIAAAFAACSVGVGADADAADAAAVASVAAWHAESDAQRRDALELLDAAGWPA